MNNQVNSSKTIGEFAPKSTNLELKPQEDITFSSSSNIEVLEIFDIHDEKRIKNSFCNPKTHSYNEEKEVTFDKLQDSDIKSIADMVPHEDAEENHNLEKVKENLPEICSGIIFEDKFLSKSDMMICCICYRVFSSRYKLDSHLNRVHDYKHHDRDRCSILNKTKINEDNDWPPNIQKLARQVNGTKIFFCNLCTYNVNRCDSMSKHMLRVHSKGRVVAQFQCEICGKTFIDKGYLKNHSVSHQSERLHKCHVCGLDFHRQSSLKRHIQGHSEDKQFSCTLCEYQTNRKHLMYRHADLHRSGRAYSCRLCGGQFFTQLSFRSHMYNHNPSPNSCSFCKVNFSSRERMLCHMKKAHFVFQINIMNIESNEQM